MSNDQLNDSIAKELKEKMPKYNLISTSDKMKFIKTVNEYSEKGFYPLQPPIVENKTYTVTMCFDPNHPFTMRYLNIINPPVIEPRSAEEVKDILKSAATKAEA